MSYSSRRVFGRAKFGLTLARRYDATLHSTSSAQYVMSVARLSSNSMAMTCPSDVGLLNSRPTSLWAHNVQISRTLSGHIYNTDILYNNGQACTRLSICMGSTRFLSSSTSKQSKTENVMNVFDRKTKRIQRNRTAVLDPTVYDYLKEEIGFRVADRISDVKRPFGVALDLGCGRGHVSKHILTDNVDFLYQCDMAEKVLAQSEVSPEVPTQKLHVDEEYLPFKEDTLDLVVSSLSLHWVNNLPGCFQQINKILKDDGCFMGALFGGDTLYELRVSLQLAETEREGGFAPHISPFTSVQDLGNLLHRAGFVMLTIDIDDIIVNYPSMFELMADLKGMGENNCAWNRRLLLPKGTQSAAAATYKEMYGKDQEGIPATFQTIYFIGWKTDLSQPKPAQRGSGQVSLKQLDQLDHLRREVEKEKRNPGNKSRTQRVSSSVEQLASDIERLRNQTQTGNEEEGDNQR